LVKSLKVNIQSYSNYPAFVLTVLAFDTVSSFDLMSCLYKDKVVSRHLLLCTGVVTIAVKRYKLQLGM